MGKRDAVDGLPTPYAELLLLRLAGAGDEEIASRLGVAPESIANLGRLAHTKLAALRDGFDAEVASRPQGPPIGVSPDEEW